MQLTGCRSCRQLGERSPSTSRTPKSYFHLRSVCVMSECSKSLCAREADDNPDPDARFLHMAGGVG
eukprot:17721-Eustigmatos_ZCMA.PRE.1